MKKRTKKVLSFGVAALMAVSALPFSALSVSASIPTKQTENGGTPYNFLLEEQGSGVQTISISKDEIAAGDVTKTLDVFIDSEEWPDDNYLSSVKLNWVATKDATFADGVQLQTVSTIRTFSTHLPRSTSMMSLCRTVWAQS